MNTRTMSSLFFFFNDTATTEIYTLSLHDALPIFSFADLGLLPGAPVSFFLAVYAGDDVETERQDRKSTRLNSSHVRISYAVFCLKKKKMEFLEESYLAIKQFS